MQQKRRRITGLLETVIGIAVVVIAVMLFGLTKTSNGESTVDWISAMTAIGGLVVAGEGLRTLMRHS
jgi:hypothetical protein